MYYGKYNTRADTRRHSHGFANTWAIVRFENKADRETFLDALDHKLAAPVTRQEAAEVWERNFRCVGDEIPTGGLFARRDDCGRDGFQGVDWELLSFDIAA